MERFRRLFLTLVLGSFVVFCLSIASFVYVYLPAGQLFETPVYVTAKVVGKTRTRLFFGRFHVLRVWDLSNGQVEAYFASDRDYLRVVKGNMVGFKHSGTFIRGIVLLD